MSVDTIVILRDDRLPSRDAWQGAIESSGIDLRLDQIDDLRAHVGYLPTRLDGVDSGFEWYYGTVAAILGEKFEAVGGQDHAAAFVTQGDLRELTGALLAAGVLARTSGGLFFDQESGSFVSGDRAIEIAMGISEAEKDRKKRLAEKDAGLTARRCPSCGAPCPSYRRTCKACGTEVGRA